MGSFDIPAPISYIHATLVNRVTSFRMSYIQDPWTLPSPSSMVEGRVHVGMAKPLSAAEIAYQAIQQATTDPDQTPMVTEEDDLFPEPIWAQNSSNSQDCLNTILPSDEAIIEAMVGAERPWEDLHHRSYFLLNSVELRVESSSQSIVGSVDGVVNPLARHGVYAKETWLTYQKRSQSTFLRILKLSKTSLSEQNAHRMRSLNIRHSLRNFEMCSHGLTRKCLALILE
jgi:hypothetical protein